MNYTVEYHDVTERFPGPQAQGEADGQIGFNSYLAWLIRRDPFTGRLVSMEIKTVGPEALAEQIFRYRMGRAGLIQEAFPGLEASEREFIMTGISPKSWDDNIPKDE